MHTPIEEWLSIFWKNNLVEQRPVLRTSLQVFGPRITWKLERSMERGIDAGKVVMIFSLKRHH